MTFTTMSPNEFKIMELMWKEKKPVTRAEILRGTEGRNWNPASIHLILNAMISKGVIKITDENIKYGRTYETVMTREDYIMSVIENSFPGEDAMQVLKDCVKLYKKLNK